ncbi:C-5 cytosine-specific DNA methylase [Pseudomonas aeruginosa]|nr:C-5 cytosine-specific DNA methylase [Pseudomonas aeruginosa]
MIIKRTLYHFHFCCGLGGGAAGFNRARPRSATSRPNGSASAGSTWTRPDCATSSAWPVSRAPCWTLTRDQYVRFHGKEPPTGWREATPEDIRRAAGGRRPDAVFISSPCKGASGLLSEK